VGGSQEALPVNAIDNFTSANFDLGADQRADMVPVRMRPNPRFVE
jgi:hypothetical protein